MRYFIHSNKQTGSKFLCETTQETILIHGEYDTYGKEWTPFTERGKPYQPLDYSKAFIDKDYHKRFHIEETNKWISKAEFDRVLTIIKEYKDIPID